MRINKLGLVVLHIVPLYFVLFGLWVMNDIFGCIALTEKLGYPIEYCGVTNGFWTLNHYQAFHVALYLIIFGSLLLWISCMVYIDKSYKQ